MPLPLLPDMLDLLEALRALCPDGPPSHTTSPAPAAEALLHPLCTRVAGGLGSALWELPVALLALHGAWGVAPDPQALAALEPVLGRRTWQELGTLGDAADAERLAGKLSEKFEVIAVASVSAAAAGSQRGGLLASLLRRAVLPLAALRCRLRGPDLFTLALFVWRGGGYAGLQAGEAATLLGWVADNAGWAHTPGLREEVECLLVRCLSEAALPELYERPEQLAPVLLSASRVLRVMAHKAGASVESVAPRAAPLLLPGAEELGAAAQALFVELGWREGGQQHHQHGLPPSLRLAGLLAAAEPDLYGCSPAACGYMLAAAVRCGVEPPAAWLARCYAAAGRALRAGERDVEAWMLVGLVGSATVLSGQQPSGQAHASQRGPPLELQGETHVADAGAVCAAARGELLRAVAERLLQPRTLSELQQPDDEEGAELARRRTPVTVNTTTGSSRGPDAVVRVVRQVAELGAGHLPGTWLSDYADVARGQMSGLSQRGLADVAQSAALLRLPLPPSWLEVLLQRAERLATPPGGSVPDWRRYDSVQLGLLLGAVRALAGGEVRQAPDVRSAGQGAPCAPPSEAARRAWERAHSAFVGESLNALPRYSPGQLHSVVAAVAAFELARGAPGLAAAAGTASWAASRPPG